MSYIEHVTSGAASPSVDSKLDLLWHSSEIQLSLLSDTGTQHTWTWVYDSVLLDHGFTNSFIKQKQENHSTLEFSRWVLVNVTMMNSFPKLAVSKERDMNRMHSYVFH